MPNVVKYAIFVADDIHLIFIRTYFYILQTKIQYYFFSLTHCLFSNKLTLNVYKIMLYKILNSKSIKRN